MTTAKLTLVDPVEATVLCDRVLRDQGAPARHAALQARVLVEADLRGRPSHGLQRLPTLVARIRRGLLDPAADPTVTWPAHAFASVDGNDGLGPVAAGVAIKALAARTSTTGVAAAAVRNSSHVGMLSPYLEELCERGLVALMFTTSEALVHPAGGRQALLGTNPVGIGIPSGSAPFILDMSTAAISAGEIISHAQRGEALPPGRAVDRDGRATTDPEAALQGAISPFGGAKGYGLALGIELLVALLSATAVGTEVLGTLDTEHRVTKGDVMVAFDPASVGLARDDERLTAYLDVLRSTPVAPGHDHVLIPGDRMRAERARRFEHGIPYPAALWQQLLELRGLEVAE